MGKTRAAIQATYRARKEAAGYKNAWVKCDGLGLAAADIEGLKTELAKVKKELAAAKRNENSQRVETRNETACQIAGLLIDGYAAGIAKAILKTYYIRKKDVERRIDKTLIEKIDKAGAWFPATETGLFEN